MRTLLMIAVLPVLLIACRHSDESNKNATHDDQADRGSALNTPGGGDLAVDARVPTTGISNDCLLQADPATWNRLHLRADQVEKIKQMQGRYKGTGSKSTEGTVHDPDRSVGGGMAGSGSEDGVAGGNSSVTAGGPVRNGSVMQELSGILDTDQLQAWVRLCTGQDAEGQGNGAQGTDKGNKGNQ